MFTFVTINMKSIMRKILMLIVLISLFGCSTAKINETTTVLDENTAEKKPQITIDDIKLLDVKAINYYANTITKDDLQKHLKVLTSDEFEGRRTGEKGQKLAAKYIVDFYKKIGVEPAIAKTKSFLQEIPKSFLKGRSNANTENVLGFILGNEKPEEIIVISGHYDHLGESGSEIYHGADDNGSGTSAVLEIAEAFRNAVEKGEGPKRSILFLNLTGEEEGLFGSSYYTSNPIFPLKNTVVDLNIDMIGRVDEKYADNPNYVYLIGADKISTELHYISEAVNKKYINLNLDYTYNDENDPNRFYYRSDHYNFAKNGVPIIFYFNGVHADYHQITDTEDKINYDLLVKRTKLVFLTAWELANREERLKID